MTFWKILVVGILIPIITPIFVAAYLMLVPGDMVGSVDGWLGYLGGYSGGFLAFISAYFIFQRDQRAKNKTVLNVRTCTTTKDEILSAKYHAYYTKGNKNDIKLEATTGRVSGVDDYPVIKVRIKNICTNYASFINLTIDKSKLKPLMCIKGHDLFGNFDSIAELEGKEVFEFILHIDPHLWGAANSLSCTLTSYNLLEVENNQKFVLHKGSTGGLTFESKT